MEGKTTGKVRVSGRTSREMLANSVEPEVWTERMVTTLEEGVRGGKWHSLIDKVWQEKTLQAAWKRVRKNRGSAGVDRETVGQFDKQSPQRLKVLSDNLRTGKYVADAVRRVHIPKGDGSTRPLGIPAVSDRTVQAAVKLVIEPIFENEFCAHSYGFRPGKSTQQALDRVTMQLTQGYRYVVDADIKKFFDSVSHELLMKRVAQHISDGRVLQLIEMFLNQRVLEGMREWTPSEGTPQGGVISPLLANIFLHPLDTMAEHQGWHMTRYADDFVVLCRTAEEAQMVLGELHAFMKLNQLELHPEKTRIVDMTQHGNEFEFLGIVFKNHKGKDYNFPRRKSISKFRDAIRAHTRRANGNSLETIIKRVNAVARGWYRYFARCHFSEFTAADGRIRARLRALLKRRSKRHGRLSVHDSMRWPNTFFAAQGLFSMSAAHAAVRNSTQ